MAAEHCVRPFCAVCSSTLQYVPGPPPPGTDAAAEEARKKKEQEQTCDELREKAEELDDEQKETLKELLLKKALREFPDDGDAETIHSYGPHPIVSNPPPLVVAPARPLFFCLPTFCPWSKKRRHSPCRPAAPSREVAKLSLLEAHELRRRESVAGRIAPVDGKRDAGHERRFL